MNILKKIKTNWKSGITVSLIAMPLSISLAVASGSTPTVGILTAIWAGLVASLLGGSNFNVVGPTGALSGLIATYALIHGTSALAALAIVAGIFILIAYALKLERYLIFIPSSVVHGFTLGVAFIIGFGQFNSAFGLSGLAKHETFFENLVESLRHAGALSLPALCVFAFFLLALFALKRWVPKIPGALLLSPLGIALGYASATHLITLRLTTLGAVFPQMAFKLFEPYHFVFSTSVISAGAAIALIAILETMLSAKIADSMTRTKHDEGKEMWGLGLANIASGLMGGIPATAALARTSLNIKTGANDKMSATIASISLFAISFFLLSSFSFMPMPVIAAILVFVALQMVEVEQFVRLYRHQRFGFWLSLAVATVTVYEDPIAGILFGTAVALILFVEKLSHGHFDIKLNTFDEGLVHNVSGDSLKEIKENADILLYSIKGKLAYINSRAHVKRFEENLVKYKIIILRLRSVYFMDLDGAEAIDEIIDIVEKRGQTICITSVNEKAETVLAQVSKGYARLREKGLVFAKSKDALAHFGISTKEQ